MAKQSATLKKAPLIWLPPTITFIWQAHKRGTNRRQRRERERERGGGGGDKHTFSMTGIMTIMAKQSATLKKAPLIWLPPTITFIWQASDCMYPFMQLYTIIKPTFTTSMMGTASRVSAASLAEREPQGSGLEDREKNG